MSPHQKLALFVVLAVVCSVAACSGEPSVTVEEVNVTARVPRPIISATVILPSPCEPAEALDDAGAD